MHDPYAFVREFATQQYGQLYIVSGRHARGKTMHIYLLEQGQVLNSKNQHGPNNTNTDVSEHQKVYGVVSGHPGWTEQYGWLNEHPRVKDQTVQPLVNQLIAANEHAIALGMARFDERQAWLHAWAFENLGNAPLNIDLPDLMP